MRIHLLSDLHREFSPFVPEVSDVDVVILAGDIDIKSRGVAWAKQAFAGRVLYVLGNHELYGGHMLRTLEKMRLAGDERVQILDRDEVIIDGVRFLGATMWTDFAAMGNPQMAALNAQHAMNDFRQIRTDNYRRIKPSDLSDESLKTHDWLRTRLSQPHDGPTVVITHHAPVLRSIQGSPNTDGVLDAAYANAWDHLLGPPVDLWLHGHTHFAVDFCQNGTRVVSNPRGYPGEETGFNPALVLTLEK